MKPHSIRRAAQLLTDKARIESDILKLRSALYSGQIWDEAADGAGGAGAFVLAADVYFTRTTDERMAEIMRSGLIADLEKTGAEIDAEYLDLQRQEPLVAPIEPPPAIEIEQVKDAA